MTFWGLHLTLTLGLTIFFWPMELENGLKVYLRAGSWNICQCHHMNRPGLVIGRSESDNQDIPFAPAEYCMQPPDL